MPTYLDRAQVYINTRFSGGYNVRFCAKAEGMFECEFAFEELFCALFFAFIPSFMPRRIRMSCNSEERTYKVLTGIHPIWSVCFDALAQMAQTSC